MTSLTTVLTWLAGLIALQLIGLAPFVSPIRAIYRPPNGRWVLVVTWVAAFAATWSGFKGVTTRWGVFTFMFAIPLDLIATFLQRDEARDYEKYAVLQLRRRRW